MTVAIRAHNPTFTARSRHVGFYVPCSGSYFSLFYRSLLTLRSGRWPVDSVRTVQCPPPRHGLYRRRRLKEVRRSRPPSSAATVLILAWRRACRVGVRSVAIGPRLSLRAGTVWTGDPTGAVCAPHVATPADRQPGQAGDTAEGWGWSGILLAPGRGGSAPARQYGSLWNARLAEWCSFMSSEVSDGTVCHPSEVWQKGYVAKLTVVDFLKDSIVHELNKYARC